MEYQNWIATTMTVQEEGLCRGHHVIVHSYCRLHVVFLLLSFSDVKHHIEVVCILQHSFLVICYTKISRALS